MRTLHCSLNRHTARFNFPSNVNTDVINNVFCCWIKKYDVTLKRLSIGSEDKAWRLRQFTTKNGLNYFMEKMEQRIYTIRVSAGGIVVVNMEPVSWLWNNSMLNYFGEMNWILYCRDLNRFGILNFYIKPIFFL